MSAPSFARLASANTYDNSLRNLQTRQAALSTLQESLTSGKKITRPSDDPTGAAQAERAMNRIARIATDQRALDAQRNAITQAEGTLGNISDAMQSFRELVVSAGNGSLSAADRSTIATQLSGLRDQIFAQANSKDSNGMPLFAALGSSLAPFTAPQATAAGYTFNGLPGQTAAGQYTIPSTLDGESTFMHTPARDGVFNVQVTAAGGAAVTGRTLTTDTVGVSNTATVSATAAAAQAATGVDYPSYSISIATVDTTTTPGTTTITYNVSETPPVSTISNPQTASFSGSGTPTFAINGIPGLSLNLSGTPAVGDKVSIAPRNSIFSVLDTAIQDIGSAANGNAATQAVRQALKNIDTGMARISAARGQAGDLLGRADRITTDNTKRSAEQEANRSSAEDVDMVKAVSDFQAQQTGYSAALQSYAQVQKLSLFNFLG